MLSILRLGLFALLTARSTVAFANKDAQRVLKDYQERTRILHQFPNPTWIENLAIRRNGEVLVTLLNAPELHILPGPGTTRSGNSSRLLHSFPCATGLLGITEIDEDIFAIIAGNFSLTTLKTVPGSYSIWTITFDSEDDEASLGREPGIVKVVDIPEALFLNGLANLPGERRSVLAADSGLGAVWKIDTRSGRYERAIKIPEFAPIAGSIISLGINGLQVVDGYLYFSNTNQETLSRMPITPMGHVPIHATVETLLSGSVVDDFAIGHDSTVWQTTNTENTILSVHHGKVKTALGSISELTVAGATSARFGRGEHLNSLFISTNGGLARPVNGNETEGGKIVVFDIEALETVG